MQAQPLASFVLAERVWSCKPWASVPTWMRSKLCDGGLIEIKRFFQTLLPDRDAQEFLELMKDPAWRKAAEPCVGIVCRAALAAAKREGAKR